MVDITEPVTDLEQLPLDEWNGEDGDNSVLANGVFDPTPEELKQSRISELAILDKSESDHPDTLSSTAPALYVPLRRSVKFGTVGWDALAVKRSLSRAGFGTWGHWGTPQKVFGRAAVQHLKGFQAKNGLRVDGVYGESTHRKLAKYFDSYGAFLMKKATILPSKRLAVVNAAIFGYHNRYSIHYTQSSLRMYGVRNHLKPPHIPRYEDCSSFATWCYYVAGASDPNAFNYAGWGYTGTLINHGRRLRGISEAKPGDLIFYGRYSIPSHVAICIGNGNIISMGSEVGPSYTVWNYRYDFHSIRSYL